MAINFRKFTNDLSNFFESYSARDGKDTARFITNLYVTNVLQGTDASFRNVILKFNKSALENSLNSAFNIAFGGNTNAHFSQVVSVGLIGFWSGGTLAFAVPPPGSISVVSNIVINPGSPQRIKVRSTTNFKAFAIALVQMFRRHMASLQGITIALVPTPTGATIPANFPWLSYR